MKIICIDNFDREIYEDKLVCEKIGKSYGEVLVEMLNEKFSGDTHSDYYILVENDYKLFIPNY